MIATLKVGQDPQALVYVAGAGGSANLSRQGLDRRIENFVLEIHGAGSAAGGQVQVREVLGLDEIDLSASGLVPSTAYTLYGRKPGGALDPLLTVTSDARGSIPEALGFVRFFGNWVAVVLAPS